MEVGKVFTIEKTPPCNEALLLRKSTVSKRPRYTS